MNIAYRRVWGVVLRHLYAFSHTGDRIVDAFYWPAIDIVIWGLTIGAIKNFGLPETHISMVIIGVIFWYCLWRAQGDITVSFLEELWSDNLGNLFATPLTVYEWMMGVCTLGILKLVLTAIFTSVLSLFLYSVQITDLGFALIPFVLSLLLFGWAVGLFLAGLFLRHGTSIQTLAWAGGSILMPFSAVYYPLSSLPVWIQTISSWLPSSYVFEGMRVVLYTGVFPTDMMVKSFLLDIVYIGLAIWFFLRSFQYAKKKGLGSIR